MAGENAAIARRWFREAWLDNGEAVIDELMAPECTGLIEGRAITCADDFKAARRQLLEIFPDLAVAVEDVIEDGANVAVRWTAEGTHRGAGLGIPPTDRRVSFRGMTWIEVRNGRIVRGWDNWNVGGLIMKLSARP